MLDQLNGLWAIEAGSFRGLAALAQSPGSMTGRKGGTSRPSGPADGNIALIPVVGVLTKSGGWLSDFFGGTSTVDLRAQLSQAADSADVDAIMLYIDSPGGQAKGTAEAAEAVSRAVGKKPVYAYIEDMCASAAYWIASGATKVFANAPALVGSIGTYSVMLDGSRAAEKAGVTVHVIRAGDFKGMGEFGTSVTSEQLAEAQRIVDSINSFFVAGVARGRKLAAPKVQALADGRIHPAADAKQMGLIDAVCTFEQSYAQLKAAAASKNSDAGGAGPAAKSSAAGPRPVAKSTLTPMEKRKALQRGWQAAIQLEFKAGAKSNTQAQQRAIRNHPGLYKALISAIVSPK